ncbi:MULTISPECIES: hypothetical protein [Rhodococcus]|uniref:Uncharacterized protein n=1 Tax=Rhodococcus opacus RKJ300 = JCM 13270 TaxID=1165867 RepID=I0WTP4_RHOOP|nr:MULTISPECIES: hypothetical protein [Rhodococcus]EID79760.1 hypothetical protein W59_11901 [Rhodococcus opacus RKJ300 = JCM 13270]QQZ18395.1 hypothetical protein GO592_40065 [Rhodococcus sp. 21391]
MALPAGDIADLIDRLKSHFVLSVVGLPVLVHDRREEFLQMAGVDMSDPVSLNSGEGNERYILPIKESLDAVQTDRTMQMNLVRSWAELSVLKVGQEMKNAKYFNDHRPIFEYLRHVRNAVAHGNAFHFQGSNPVKHPASFRSHHIDTRMEGTICVSGELKVGEVFLLLDDIASDLRTLP